MHRAIFLASVTFAFALVGVLLGGKYFASVATHDNTSLIIAFAIYPIVGGVIGFGVAFVALRLYPPKK